MGLCVERKIHLGEFVYFVLSSSLFWLERKLNIARFHKCSGQEEKGNVCLVAAEGACVLLRLMSLLLSVPCDPVSPANRNCLCFACQEGTVTFVNLSLLKLMPMCLAWNV